VIYSFCAVENFAGGFAAGATLAGMHLVANRELPGGFGVPMMEANRAFLGDGWQTQVDEAEKWEPVRADVQVSNPPCSAFSGMTAGYAVHGIDSKINDCMWHAIRYAARVRPAVFVMESVSQAFTNGKDLMRRLADELNEKSGLAYRTTHVIQDNYSLGGVTKRKRYFLVLSQVPFGIEAPGLKWLPTVGDALSDLKSTPQRWELQPYTAPPTWWSHGLRSASGCVDGHHFEGNRRTARLMDLVNGLQGAGEPAWLPGEPEEDIPKRYYEKFGALPESWQYATAGKVLTRDKQLLERGFKTGGFAQTRYWPWDKPGRVINGAGPHMVWHPDMRHATHREVARLMGFPDDWLIEPLRNDTKLHSYWGKGTSVAPAQWICTWIHESLDGSPGSVTGELQEDGSRLIDVSKNWQDVEKRLAAPPRRVEALPLPPVPLKGTVPPLPRPSLENKGSKRQAEAMTLEDTRPKSPFPARKVRVVAMSGDLPPKAAKPPRDTSPKPQEWRELLPSGFRVRSEDEYVVREVFTGAYRKLDIRPGDRILDLGAHTGSFAIWAAQRGAPHVTAVEMWPETVEVLRENTKGTLVDIWYGAVTDGSHPPVALLGKRANPMKASVDGTRFTDHTGNTRQNRTRVPRFSFLELLEASKPDIIKFSIEASEGFVITPHAGDLAARRVRQVIGLHHISDERLLRKAQELHTAMTAAGYEASRAAPVKTSGWAATICYTLR
jgi:FkbM family methyltransferase